jgi:hypothetical protein
VATALHGKHARDAYFVRDYRTTCTDLASYIDGVLSRRGKTIAPATADALVAQARRLQRLVPCGQTKAAH